MSEKLKRPSIRAFLIALFLGFGTWWGIVALSGGANVNILPGVEWDFERTGQLGDSFGILSAFMGSLAAFFTFQALMDEREANRKLLHREEQKDIEAAQAASQAAAREEERSRIASIDLSEARLFRMLELRLSIVNSMSLSGSGGHDYIGQHAIDEHFWNLKQHCGEPPDPEKISRYLSSRRKGLGHYFRFTYHILLDIKEGALSYDDYRYGRLLRAQMSENEMALVAVNCAYGEGRDKFADLAAHFTFFHNLSESNIHHFDLRKILPDSCFDRPLTLKAPLHLPEHDDTGRG